MAPVFTVRIADAETYYGVVVAIAPAFTPGVSFKYVYPRCVNRMEHMFTTKGETYFYVDIQRDDTRTKTAPEVADAIAKRLNSLLDGPSQAID